MCPVSGHRKNHATPSGPGHCPFAYRELYQLHPPQGAPLFRRVAGPIGGGSGVMAGVAPAISARFHIGFSRGVHHVSQSKAVLFAAVLRSIGGFHPPPCVVSGCFHAQSSRSGSGFIALPVLSGCCLSFLQRQHKMSVLRLSSAARRSSSRVGRLAAVPPACSGGCHIRGFYGLLYCFR